MTKSIFYRQGCRKQVRILITLIDYLITCTKNRLYSVLERYLHIFTQLFDFNGQIVHCCVGWKDSSRLKWLFHVVHWKVVWSKEYVYFCILWRVSFVSAKFRLGKSRIFTALTLLQHPAALWRQLKLGKATLWELAPMHQCTTRKPKSIVRGWHDEGTPS